MVVAILLSCYCDCGQHPDMQELAAVLMRFVKLLVRFFIILPVYGSLVALAFVCVVWILLELLLLLATHLFGTPLQWTISEVITTQAYQAGVILIAIGNLCNVIVFVANGFKMPVKGLSTTFILHRPLNSSTRLPFLADILPAPFGIRVSIGDLFLFAGLAIVVGLFALR